MENENMTTELEGKRSEVRKLNEEIRKLMLKSKIFLEVKSKEIDCLKSELDQTTLNSTTSQDLVEKTQLIKELKTMLSQRKSTPCTYNPRHSIIQGPSINRSG